jgi:septum formation protein
LLAALGLPFDVVVAAVTEHEDPATDPRAMVSRNAALKADWVSVRHPDAFVLAADTTVFLDGLALNKPADLAESRRMLARLSGRTHTVFTGVALRRAATGLQVDESVSSEVDFKAFGSDVIESYPLLVNTLDKAGGYSIQEHADLIIARHRGSLSSIMGLPMDETKHILTRCGLLH